MKHLIIFTLIHFSINELWQDCKNHNLNHAIDFFTIFNVKLDFQYSPAEILNEHCQLKTTYIFDNSEYYAIQLFIGGEYKCNLYMLYELLTHATIEGKNVHRVNRLLQPWEPAYMSIIEENDEKTSECTGIWQKKEQNRKKDLFLLQKKAKFFDLSNFKLEEEIYGNYADNWTGYNSHDFFAVIGILMNRKNMIIDILDIRSLKKQTLLLNNYEVTLSKKFDNEFIRFCVELEPNTKKRIIFKPDSYAILDSLSDYEKHLKQIENKNSYKSPWDII